MKKRYLVSGLLSAATILTITPTTTFAAERPPEPASAEAEDSNGQKYTSHRVEENEVYVAGTRVGTTKSTEYYLNDGNGGITEENASSDYYNVSYDPTSGTITLNDAYLSKTAYTDHTVLFETQQYPRDVSDDAVILSRRDITIQVIGDNIIENKRKAPDKTYTGLHRHGIDVFADLTITGDGTEESNLTVRSSDQNDGEWANSVGVNVSGGDLTVENVTLVAQGRETTYCSAGLYVAGGSGVIKNSDIDISSGSVKPINEAAVAVSWTGSYGLVSESGDMVIDNSEIDIQAGEGYTSAGVLISSPSSALKVQNNSSLKATASKEAALSYGISGGLNVNHAYVEARSEGAKDIPYTYGGTSYGGDAYSYGYSGYTYDENNVVVPYQINVDKGSIRFLSGDCLGATNAYSTAYDGYIANLDYSTDPYAIAQYNLTENSDDAETWLPDCEGADQENGMVLKNGYQYFEITHEFVPAGTVTWIDENDNERPDSLSVTLKHQNSVMADSTAISNGENEWTFDFGLQSVYHYQITGDYRAEDAWDLIDYTIAVNNPSNKYDTVIEGSAYTNGGFSIEQTYIKDEETSDPETEPDQPNESEEETNKPSKPEENPNHPADSEEDPENPGESEEQPIKPSDQNEEELSSETATESDTTKKESVAEDESPDTGESSHFTLWVLAMIVSIGAIVGGLLFRTKKKVQ